MGAQAHDNRGREVELTWSEPGAAKKYCMSVKMDAGLIEPGWTLWEDDGVETKLVWKYQTIDYDLINDVICMLNQPAPAAAPAPPANVGHSNPPLSPSAPAQPESWGAGSAPAGQSQSYGGAQSAQQGQQYASGVAQATQQPQHVIGGPPAAFQQQPPGASPFQQYAPTSASPPLQPQSPGSMGLEGRLDETKTSTLIHSIAASRITGKLELCGDDTTGDIFFVDGIPKHATTPSAYGDGAIRELCTWEKGTYIFKRELKTDMRSVDGRLDTIIAEGLAMLDQKRHLKKSGLGYESYLIRKHKQMGEAELKLMLSRGAPIDFAYQRKIWDYLKHKRTFTDLLRDHPMDSTTWTSLLFNFLSCGLMEIRAPETVKTGALDFLGDAAAHVKTLTDTFNRPETGIYSYAALLVFLQYEYARFEAYNWPLSLVLFEIQYKRQDGTGGSDLLAGEAVNMAAMRIGIIKRPLDTLGHFETLDYALVLPNTSGASAAWVANRIYESLTATPLGKGLDRNTLSIAFGIASLPADGDGDDLESLVLAARAAKVKAKTGTFPVVLSRSSKKPQ